jgi:hypothetical protein
LGHIQRGGSPTARDRILATNTGHTRGPGTAGWPERGHGR